MMSKFYSSLIINSRSYPNVHQVFRPRFNKEFFKRITANMEQLEAQIDHRYETPDPLLSNEHLKVLRENSKRLVKLKERLEETNEDDIKYGDILAQLEAIEDLIMPTVVKIPNRSSKLVPPEDLIIEELSSDFIAKQNLFKVLSHRKLAYINHCYSKSVVGPNSHYYFGIGAKLQNALSDYFISQLERDRFIPISGLCLTKSALVEATNSSDHKEYSRDPARILTDSYKPTTIHLSEASREALVGLVSTIGPVTTNNPLKLMTSGAGYRLGSDWFDGDDKRITQFETLHALVLNSSIEQYSMKECMRFKDHIWSSYKKLELPLRLVHCSLENMFSNEYDSHRIDVWLPSRQEWLQVGRISHYLDYITVRVGLKRGHLIDSTVFDGQVLAAAIIENRQTSTGKFMIPNVLKAHSMHLTNEECDSYFGGPIPPTPKSLNGPKTQVLSNYEQRRYLTKRNHPFGHSRKAQDLARQMNGNRVLMALLSFLMLIFVIIDWNEFWMSYVPDLARRCLYDYFYRPLRRIWWFLVHPKGTQQPPDLSYADIDKAQYEKSMWKRKKEASLMWQHRSPEQMMDRKKE